MRAVDTNVLVRLIVRDDSSQVAAAEKYIENGTWVSVVALAEAIWVLSSSYKFSSHQQVMTLGLLLNKDSLVIQDRETIAAAIDQFRAKPSLGFSDCLILEMARKAGHLPLGTFDRALAKVHGTQRL